MRTSRLLCKTAITATLLASLAPSAAQAHSGHDLGYNLMAGLLHPLTGLDHLLMVVAVGAWAALQPPARRLVIAGCLALFMGAGALLPVTGGPALEAAIALTVVGAGILLTIRRPWPMPASGLLVATFALIHGFAHGAEGPPNSSLYIAGLTLTTSAIALAASSVAARVKSHPSWLRIAGVACTLSGTVVLVTS
jgi:urease accessory protein